MINICPPSLQSSYLLLISLRARKCEKETNQHEDRRNMSTPDVKAIVPVMATKQLSPVGGIPMLQAIPMDYSLAASVIRYLQNTNPEDLEFILKAYLPIAGVYTTKAGQYFGLEPIGANMIQNILPHVSLPAFPSSISEANTITEATHALENTLRWFDENDFTHVESIAGVIPRDAAKAIFGMIEWPDKGAEEPYSVRFPSPLDSNDLISTASVLGRRIDALHGIYDELSALERNLGNKIENLVQNASKEVITRTERLDQRISVLRDDIEKISPKIEYLESEENPDAAKIKAMKNTLQNREAALERDQKRRESVEDRIGESVKHLEELQTQLSGKLQHTLNVVSNGVEEFSDFAVPPQSEGIDGEILLFLLPLLLFGQSHKGRLLIDIHSCGSLLDTEDRVGMRRDFVDPFESLNARFVTFISEVSETIGGNVSIRRSLLKYAEEYNLLALSETRNMLMDGCKLLVSDGLLKDSLVEEVRNLLDSIPVADGIRAESIRMVPYRSKDESVATVRFQVRSDSGQAICDAIVELGGLRLKTDKMGLVSVDLPRSNYEGHVRADGFVERKFEFNLNTSQDLAIPIILESLPYEELISRSLDRLVKRTENLESIQSRLRKAFEDYGSKLVKIPIYRTALTELLTELGYEPEAWISKAKKESQMVGRLLNKSAREDSIRRDLLRIARASKESGGIILLSELITRLHDFGWEIDVDDLDEILKNLSDEGVIQGVSALEGGAKLVKFIPVGLTSDPRRILSLASRHNGKLSMEQILVELNWTEERAQNALELLVSGGVAKIQRSYAKSTTYWFPGLITRKE